MIAVVLITHGAFGAELLRTAQDMVGRQEKVFSITMTSDMGPDGIGKALQSALGDFCDCEGILILVDMMGGTPCNVALMRGREDRIEIVSGMNLYMILSSFTNRERMPLHDLAAKVVEDGRKAVMRPKELLARKSC